MSFYFLSPHPSLLLVLTHLHLSLSPSLTILGHAVVDVPLPRQGHKMRLAMVKAGYGRDESMGPKRAIAEVRGEVEVRGCNVALLQSSTAGAVK